MSATAWLIVAISTFSLAGILLVAAVLMFIKFSIISVIGDLTGRTVAKEIKMMREVNYSSGDKRFKSSPVNINRGTLTEKVNDEPEERKKVLGKAHASKRLDKRTGELAAETPSKLPKTDNLTSINVREVETEATAKLTADATEVLSASGDNATEVLSEATEVLTPETEVLSDVTPQGGTTVLNSDDQPEKAPEKVNFKVTKSVEETHSDEVI